MKVGIMLVGLMLAPCLALAALSPDGAAPAMTDRAPTTELLGVVPSNGGSPELHTIGWTDNPEETLHYDGVNNNAIGLTGGGTFRGAVRFTPTTSCTVKSILFYQRNASSNDYVFIFAEGNDTIPGAIIDSAPYTGTGRMQWKRINMPNPIVVTAGLDFWACVRCTHLADSFPLGVDAGPMVRDRGGFISTGGDRWQQLADQNLNYNWNIRAIIEPVPGLDHDVGVSRILAPGQSINPGTYQPKLRVTNFGTNTETSFDVICWIDSAGSHVYNETRTVASLAPGARTELTFPDWNTGPSGAMYEMTAFTELGSDMDRSNDTMMQSIALMTGQALMDHDTGYCRLTVSAFGSVGFDQPAFAGNGFKYPKAGIQTMFLGSFAAGNGANYIADRHFGQPPSGPINNDWRPVDSLRPIVPPGAGDEHFRSVYNDVGHSSPKDVVVVQNSYMSSDPGYDDFITITFDVQNNGSADLDSMYAGIFVDYDIGTANQNRAGSDVPRRMVWMRQQTAANPTVGFKILDPPSYANLSCIDHAVYVYPDSCMTEGQKYRWLNGQLSQAASNRPYDWSVIASVGPFNLPVGGYQRVAFAFVGGMDEASAGVNADSAQSFYSNVLVAEHPAKPRLAERFTVSPNPFSNATFVHYSSPVAGRLELETYDATGRMVDLRSVDITAGKGKCLWQPKGLAHGIYFLNIRTPEQESVVKVLRME